MMDLLMTEEWLIKELEATTKQLSIWWNATVKEGSYPRKLEGKIKFLKGYLKALKNLKNEKHLGEVIHDLKEEFWKRRMFTGTIRPKVDG